MQVLPLLAIPFGFQVIVDEDGVGVTLIFEPKGSDYLEGESFAIYLLRLSYFASKTECCSHDPNKVGWF